MITLDIFDILIRDIKSESPLEIAGVFFGLISVLYERKGNVLLYPTGIISVLIYVFICYRSKLYADMGINAYYFVVSIYGWYYWLKRDSSGRQTPVSACSRREAVTYIITLIVSFIILYILLKFFTDSDVAVVDATTTAIFFTGMLLLARKKIENWYAWIAGNFISIPLYIYKGLLLTSLQFLVFLILSVSGYIIWKKLLEKETT